MASLIGKIRTFSNTFTTEKLSKKCKWFILKWAQKTLRGKFLGYMIPVL